MSHAEARSKVPENRGETLRVPGRVPRQYRHLEQLRIPGAKIGGQNPIGRPAGLHMDQALKRSGETNQLYEIVDELQYTLERGFARTRSGLDQARLRVAARAGAA